MKKLTREQWLLLAVEALKPIFKTKAGAILPKNIKCTMSFPLGRSANKVIGQCLSESISAGKKIEILINPTQSDPIQVVAILAHELIHAWDGNKNGHRGPFVRTAKAFGFVSPWTNTPMGPELKAELTALVRKLPKFPHSEVTPKSPQKKQGTRMLKLSCPFCEFICRASKTALMAWGIPVCNCGSRLELPEI